MPFIFIFVYLALLVVGLIGWVMNIVEIVETCCDPLTGMLVVRIAGILIAPLGAVLGYF